MGISIHALNFLRNAKKKKLLGGTITIGRQGLHVTESMLKKYVSIDSTYKHQAYCEAVLIEYFGATNVESIDNSGYENATHIHNMNEPLPENLYGKFDTVIDGGTLEHIYNVPQALKSCSLLCKQGGQIIHILPANNSCGHGFWQFSPELFFSLYSKENGYVDTEVFLADLSDNSKWFQVKEPKNGKRVSVLSSTPLYVLVRTVLLRSDFSHTNVQQSDYVFEWEKTASSKPKQVEQPSRIKQIIENAPLAYKILLPIYLHYKTRLNDRNPGLKMVRVESFIKSCEIGNT
jgi:hypothetical protein